MMFDNFQAYDVQETRRVSREEGRLEGRIEGERAGRIEGERTGRIEGEQLHLIKLVIKKIENNALLLRFLKFSKNHWISFSRSMTLPSVRHLITMLIRF